MNTKRKGLLAESKAIAHFIESGYEVCLPIGDNNDYDMLIEKEGLIEKVQVKYGGKYASRSDSCRVGLRITGGNQSYGTAKKYSDDSFDTLYVFTEKGDEFVIPWKDITARNEIFIEHPKYAMYNVAVR